MAPQSGSKKPKGRTTAYAYFVQACREQRKKSQPGESISFGDQSKECSERWKVLTAAQKKPYVDMQLRDKRRYDVEMEGYVPTAVGNGKRAPKKKRAKDPNAPKRSLSAFFWFCNDERPKIRGANPEFGIGDVAKELGKMWKLISETDKKKYEVMAKRDKARYEKEMSAYKQRTVPIVSVEDSEEEEVEEEEEEDDDDE
ncbi:unnamed protein product [Orchesella dallaii]|uniref:HMG box domain-containing protein n=1 Tax=Orchesella dallaii TaxID=48710 RepID=A0ABP1R5W4_9HEXA